MHAWNERGEVVGKSIHSDTHHIFAKVDALSVSIVFYRGTVANAGRNVRYMRNARYKRCNERLHSVGVFGR